MKEISYWGKKGVSKNPLFSPVSVLYELERPNALYHLRVYPRTAMNHHMPFPYLSPFYHLRVYPRTTTNPSCSTTYGCTRELPGTPCFPTAPSYFPAFPMHLKPPEILLSFSPFPDEHLFWKRPMHRYDVDRIPLSRD